MSKEKGNKKGKVKIGQKKKKKEAETRSLSQSALVSVCSAGHLDVVGSSKEVVSSRVYVGVRIWIARSLLCYGS